MNQSFYVNQNDPLTKISGQIKFGSGLRLPHDRPGLESVHNISRVIAGLLLPKFVYNTMFLSTKCEVLMA